MKKLSFKKKMIWGLIGAGALIIPTVAVSAVACSSEKLTSKIKIKTQPKNLETFVGQKTNLPAFSVAVESLTNAKFTYQWYSNTANQIKGATKIAGATSDSYTLKPQDLMKAGKTYFFVEIGGTQNNVSLTTITFNIVSLTINSEPSLSIQTQPTNQTAIITQTQNLPKFSVVVNPISDAQITYQWYESNTNSNTNGTLISGATESSYVIPTTDVNQAGTKYYYVKISGIWNKVALKPIISNPSSLIINEKPIIKISKQPSAQTATKGETENLPIFSVKVDPIQGAELTYQWYSNTINSNENGTIISGATNSSYQVTQSNLEATKYFYVVVSGTINGVVLTGVKSNPASLTVAEWPSDAAIASALAAKINALNPNVTNFPQTEELQYMAPSYAAQAMLPKIQALIQNIVETNQNDFNNLNVSGNSIKINPSLITVSTSPVATSSTSDVTENAKKSLTVAINYGATTETTPAAAAAETDSSNDVTVNGFNGFSDEQKTKIAEWFNQSENQVALMKNLLGTKQGKTFLANLLNQTFFKFVIKGLGDNFELQNVTLSNDLSFNNVTGKHSLLF